MRASLESTFVLHVFQHPAHLHIRKQYKTHLLPDAQFNIGLATAVPTIADMNGNVWYLFPVVLRPPYPGKRGSQQAILTGVTRRYLKVSINKTIAFYACFLRNNERVV